MSRHVMSCCVASDETWGREGMNLFARGGVLFKPGGHSVRLHLRTEAILPSQLFTVTRSRCYLLAYPTICVLHSVFKLSGHPSPSFIFCFPASLCGVHVLASVSRRCRLLLHRLSLLTHSFAHLTFSSFTHSLTHSHIVLALLVLGLALARVVVWSWGRALGRRGFAGLLAWQAQRLRPTHGAPNSSIGLECGGSLAAWQAQLFARAFRSFRVAGTAFRAHRRRFAWQAQHLAPQTTFPAAGAAFRWPFGARLVLAAVWRARAFWSGA